MSTRSGTVIKLDNILNTARDTMHAIMQRNETKYAQVEDPEGTADLVGKSAIMIQDMSAKR
jgi:arginyl-tRNA synthetase